MDKYFKRDQIDKAYTENKDIWFKLYLYDNLYTFKPDEICSFRKIPEFPKYRVSNYGSIVSEIRPEIKQLKPQVGSNTYMQVVLTDDQKKATKLVHVLVAQLFIPNPENKGYVDHINHNRHDNRVENLRWVSQSQNLQNKSKHKNNTSGVTGVSFYNGKWKAQICIDYTTIQLGSYFIKEDAIRARQKGEERYFGEYANKDQENQNTSTINTPYELSNTVLQSSNS
jgi:HNH endonuclease/NUMOD4 motif